MRTKSHRSQIHRRNKKVSGVGPKPTSDKDYWKVALDTNKPTGSGGYELCEFYFFRSPTLRAGFQPAQGGVLTDAATTYPDAWEWLQTTEGQLLCTDETSWQAMIVATWATLADGTAIGWNGVGGAPYYVQDLGSGTLRLPDIRGMVSEAAGYDSLTVGAVHGDTIREIVGRVDCFSAGYSGAFARISSNGSYNTSGNAHYIFQFSASRMVPTANKVAPRAYGALPCVYLGTPSE